MSQTKKKWGDRPDAVWLKDIPSMNRIMPGIMPNRADNEAFINLDVDFAPLKAYVDKKNGTRGWIRRTSIPSSTSSPPLLARLLYFGPG